MEQIKRKFRDASLRKSFIFAVACTVVVIFAASLLTIGSCVTLQKLIMPDSNEVYLTITTTYASGESSTQGLMMTLGDEDQLIPLILEFGNEGAEERKSTETRYSIDKIENSYDSLTPKRKLAYSGLSAAMVGLPMLYSVVGILVCAMWFYKKKLEGPIRILSGATENIVKKDLDFTVFCDSQDEMGRLCQSFEEMRQALYENNLELWNMIEERRMLQASVAHDLRNPIAIIEGYTEYLQVNIPQGKVSQEKLLHTVANLSTAAKRLELYTDSIRDIHNLEDMKIEPTPNALFDLVNEIADDFRVVAQQENMALVVSSAVPEAEVGIDKPVLYRILENIYTNALRYARKTVRLDFFCQSDDLVAVVSDDGCGFPDKILKAKDQHPFFTGQTEDHRGMGLAISQILCKKHGGNLTLSNLPEGGASVKVCIRVL